MFAELFYLSGLWLALSFLLVLLAGTSIRRTGVFSSLFYLLMIVLAGDYAALRWLHLPTELIVLFSGGVLGLGFVLILLLRNWNALGQVYFLFSITTTVVFLIYAFTVTVFTPPSPFAFIFSFLLFLLETAALVLSLSYAFEVLDVLCRVRWHRKLTPNPSGTVLPMVSLHVPAYNEPPELVEKTLRALANLDYPAYEVILIDNNTPDEDTWQPLAEVCQELGFKCLHLDQWPGYKSGALNFALSMTHPQAEIIGVIDADYIVQPDYLRKIVPYFEDPQIAFVQTPQDYRDYEQSRFFQAAYDGYKYFFALSMPARNERNAIIFCGTMGLLRKSVLQEIGGWDEWCITEDAEASLRILNRGYQSLYVDQSFGRGLMPLNFEGLKKQRFRWAFGGVQILKKHWNKLMPWARWLDAENRLTGAQRYFYLMSGLQWSNELLTFAFTVMVLISAILTITGHTSFLRPTIEAFVILPIVLIGTNLLRALWGLRYALSISWTRALYALTLWFSLTWVVALACIQAVVRERGVFLRTPKAPTEAAWARALQSVSLEIFLGVVCVLGGIGAMLRVPSILTVGLLLLCLSQAMIYLSAPFHSLLSEIGTGKPLLPQPDRGNIQGTFANEMRLGFQIGLVALTLIMVVFAASLWPLPENEPGLSRLYNPQPLIIPRSELTPETPTEEPEEEETPDPTDSDSTGTPLTATPTITSTLAPTPSPAPGFTATPIVPTSTTVPPTATEGATSTPIAPTDTPSSPTSTPPASATAPPTHTAPASTPTQPPAPTGTPPPPL